MIESPTENFNQKAFSFEITCTDCRFFNVLDKYLAQTPHRNDTKVNTTLLRSGSGMIYLVRAIINM